MIKKHILAWFGIAFLAVLNGAARDLLCAPFVGPLAAHQISTVSLIALIGIAAWYAGSRWPLGRVRAALTVGECWMTMTVAFEFVLGGVILGKPWSLLLRDYDFASGRIWLLVPLWLLIVPMLVVLVRNRTVQSEP